MLRIKVDGAELQSKREHMGLSQRQLCDLAGISCKTLRKMEKGGLVQQRSVCAVAGALGCNPRSLGRVAATVFAIRAA
jgi:transcriptional regulator with XRE-family HTH domain